MATCGRCARSGFFLGVDKDGLCGTCAQWLDLEARNVGRILRESVEIINSSKNLETRLSRCDTILSLRGSIRELEVRGRRLIPEGNTLTQFLERVAAQKALLIASTLEKEADEVFAKVSALATVTSKVAALSKFAVRVESFATHPNAPGSLPATRSRIQDAILRIQLDAHLDAARKAEFKGQKKKALDRYYEALYLLRHDDADDALQADQIGPIEEKIRSLGGTLS